MAEEAIGAIRGVGKGPGVRAQRETASAGEAAASEAAVRAHAVRSDDLVNISDDALDEMHEVSGPQEASRASINVAALAGPGLPGLSTGGVVTSSGVTSGGPPPGMFVAGVHTTESSRITH